VSRARTFASLAVLGGIAAFVYFIGHGSLKGSLARPPELGAGRFVPKTCSNGQHDGFFGAQILGEDGARLRVTRDATGATLVLYAAAGAMSFAPIAQTGCTRRRVDVREGSVSANHVPGMDLDLELTCGELIGSISATKCF